MRKHFILCLVLCLIVSLAALPSVSAEEAFGHYFGGDFKYAVPKGWLAESKTDAGVQQRWYYAEEIGSYKGGYIYVRIDTYEHQLDQSDETANATLNALYNGFQSSFANMETAHVEFTKIDGLYAQKGSYQQEVASALQTIYFANVLYGYDCLTYMMIMSEYKEDDASSLFDRLLAEISLIGAAARQASASESTEARYMEDYKDFTRDKPMRIGESALFGFQGSDVVLELKQVISGKDAADMIEAANMFNEQAENDQQYYIAEFVLTSYATDSSASVSITTHNFEYVTREGKVINSTPLIAGIDDSIKLYAGASGEFYISVLTGIDDVPMLVFSDTLWIDLAE